MEFAWNTQKNKMSDIKGKEYEQDRKGRISNDEIDLRKTHMNYDIVESDKTLYQRVKSRVDDVRSNSRIQKNSVVMYSNVISINGETAKEWGEEKCKRYLQSAYEFFCNEFGKENVVSAMVHLDETAPHLHLHFVPISDEGKLQARSVMTPTRINKIHTECTKFLRQRGFDVERGKGKTGKKNIKDIYEYKKSELEKLKKDVMHLEEQKRLLESNLRGQKNLDNIELTQIQAKEQMFSKNNLIVEKSELKRLIQERSDLAAQNKFLFSELGNRELQMNEVKNENKNFVEQINQNISERQYLLKKQDILANESELLDKKNDELKQREKNIVIAENNYKNKIQILEIKEKAVERKIEEVTIEYNSKVLDLKEKYKKNIKNLSKEYDENLEMVKKEYAEKLYENRDELYEKYESELEMEVKKRTAEYEDNIEFYKKWVNSLKNSIDKTNEECEKLKNTIEKEKEKKEFYEGIVYKHLDLRFILNGIIESVLEKINPNLVLNLVEQIRKEFKIGYKSEKYSFSDFATKVFNENIENAEGIVFFEGKNFYSKKFDLFELKNLHSTTYKLENYSNFKIEKTHLSFLDNLLDMELNEYNKSYKKSIIRYNNRDRGMSL